jgi:hemerythrin superfamily protein
MKILTAHSSAEEAVFPMVKETKLGKESHTDDEHLLSANMKHQVK